MSHALLLIDIQNNYFPGGAMAMAGSLEAGEVVITKHFPYIFSLCGVERLDRRPFFVNQ